jgi:hypothetical protein
MRVSQWLVCTLLMLLASSALAQAPATGSESTAVDSAAAPPSDTLAAAPSTVAPVVAPAVQPASPPAATAAPAPAAAPAAAATPAKKDNRLYFGGTLGVTFGSYTRFSIAPLVGLSLNPKISVGAKGIYEYINDTRYSPDLTASNYGGSLFTRLRLNPMVYAHAEYAYMNYETRLRNGGSERNWVPYLFLGGGAMRPLGGGMAAFVEVLFDVLQDSNSPYDAWQPFVSVGVTKGF